ncbi:MAG TPA: hypothetical protein VLB10_02745 [Gammaproteobacteria bacterium]|nr:hypothetical protein [Gammaproteobacteria bacterium]
MTGNAGGANECWGTFDGNEPGPSGDGFDAGGTIFNFVARENTPGLPEGTDIGLAADPDTGDASAGNWLVAWTNQNGVQHDLWRLSRYPPPSGRSASACLDWSA